MNYVHAHRYTALAMDKPFHTEAPGSHPISCEQREQRSSLVSQRELGILCQDHNFGDITVLNNSLIHSLDDCFQGKTGVPQKTKCLTKKWIVLGDMQNRENGCWLKMVKQISAPLCLCVFIHRKKRNSLSYFLGHKCPKELEEQEPDTVTSLEAEFRGSGLINTNKRHMVSPRKPAWSRKQKGHSKT